MEDRLLCLAMLLEHKRKAFDALSGGMYKKPALACVLSYRPPLVLLNEPTNGVDPRYIISTPRAKWRDAAFLVVLGLIVFTTDSLKFRKRLA